MEIIIAWIILSFIVASIGSDRKIGYWGTFALCLLLSPIIGALFALASQRITPSDNYLPPVVYKNYNLGRKAYKEGNTSLAIHYLNNAYSYSPNSSMILFSLAVCYSDLKDEEKAFIYLDKAVANGYKNIGLIKNSNELQFLRERPAFKKFVENGYRIPQTNLNISDRINKLEKLAELKEKEIGRASCRVRV